MEKITEEKILLLLRRYRNNRITSGLLVIIGPGALLFVALPYFLDTVLATALQALLIVFSVVGVSWWIRFLSKEYQEYKKIVMGLRRLLDNPESYISYLLNDEKEKEGKVLRKILPPGWISLFHQQQKAVA